MIRHTMGVVPPPGNGVRRFALRVAKSCGPDSRVLNVGAGQNLSGRLRPIKRQAGHIVGVDPDPSIRRNRILDERERVSAEKYAEQPRAD